MRLTRRLGRGVVACSAVTLAAAALAAPAGAGSTSSRSSTAHGAAEDASYVVLTTKADGAAAVAGKLRALGATVTSVNSDIGVVGVRSDDPGFRADAALLAGVQGVAGDRAIGRVPDDQSVAPRDAVEHEGANAPAAGRHATTDEQKSSAKAAFTG